MPQPVQITKASGKTVAFAPEKLKASLIRAGASENVAEKIVAQVTPRLYEGVATRKIFRWAFALLKKYTRPSAARYHLKHGIMELGPSGFPFEKYVAELLKAKGYSVRTGEILHGHCVDHEIDIVAENDARLAIVECKYHNTQGVFCDVKVPLYIAARFRDVEMNRLNAGPNGKLHEGWIFTNTRFSEDALRYGTCAGLKLVGWDFPRENSLREMIDRLGLYPVTCLTTLTRLEKQRLLAAGIVLCRHIYENEKLLQQNGFKAERIRAVLGECSELCREMEMA